ncbi:uncharacterized protein LOC123441834 [Hordeum vulgare subsp. vulgare]|uniref:uncharacterized protein LOC123441834 n=1 Tax=Hordeum vulgare subsp. vulgare TaxID=112509 RepID=UPI001D1A558D|nr:uncharacterized protein LOC123441834 [Hordeum vulgare subsp. vulgare]
MAMGTQLVVTLAPRWQRNSYLDGVQLVVVVILHPGLQQRWLLAMGTSPALPLRCKLYAFSVITPASRCRRPCVTKRSESGSIIAGEEQIHGFYKEVLNRLPVKGIPSLAPRLLKAGLCIGFLDPISNIILNAISYCPSLLPSLEEGVSSRKTILSKIITDTNDPRVLDIPLSAHTVHSMTVARRSLEGLVSFLIYYYRYLAEAEAVRYLRLAGADLLVAVWLIDQDRNKPSVSVSDLIERKASFDISSPTTKIALRCAATSARHPEPAILVNAALSLASSPCNVSEYLQQYPRLSIREVRCLRQWLSLQHYVHMPPIDIWRPMCLAALRLPVVKRKEKEEKTSGSSGYTESLRLLLLDKIHELYLDALSRLSGDGLCKRLACSLLKAGYCYGRMDPVSNIILNTVCYDNDPYREAARASWHPDTDALVKFFSSSIFTESKSCEPTLAFMDGGIERLAMLISRSSSHTNSSSEILSKNQKMFIQAVQKKFKADQGFFVKKVNAALFNYSQQTGVQYELQMICTVNPVVVEGTSVALFKKNCKYEYSHINFWATPKGSNFSAPGPVLFFAQCSNGDKDEDERPSMCVPVSGSWISDGILS